VTTNLKLINAALILLLALICDKTWKLAGDAGTARTLLRAPLAKIEPSVPQPVQAYSPLKAGSYLEVAERNLLSPDRNSTIISEAPPEKNPPPPPLPQLAGVVMIAGIPPTVLLSKPSGSERHAYHAGEIIGGWQIDSFDHQQITLEWQGSKVTKQIADLMQRPTIKVLTPPSPPDQSAPQQPAGKERPATASVPDRSGWGHHSGEAHAAVIN
jgi:hypothetical protein